MEVMMGLDQTWGRVQGGRSWRSAESTPGTGLCEVKNMVYTPLLMQSFNMFVAEIIYHDLCKSIRALPSQIMIKHKIPSQSLVGFKWLVYIHLRSPAQRLDVPTNFPLLPPSSITHYHLSPNFDFPSSSQFPSIFSMPNHSTNIIVRPNICPLKWPQPYRAN